MSNERRMTTLEEEKELITFVESAAKCFEENPKYITFTLGAVEPGCYLGIRWGLGEDCILVVKLDDNFGAVNFQNVIKKREV